MIDEIGYLEQLLVDAKRKNNLSEVSKIQAQLADVRRKTASRDVAAMEGTPRFHPVIPQQYQEEEQQQEQKVLAQDSVASPALPSLKQRPVLTPPPSKGTIHESEGLHTLTNQTRDLENKTV
jgi:hypothetical protein